MKVSLLVFLFTWLMIIHPVSGYSQVVATGIRPGSAVPSLFWHYQPQAQQESMLSQNRQGLIILDFWACWCTPCIKAFPELNALQRTLPEARIILVNDVASGDHPKRVRMAVAPYPLGWMHGDSTLSGWFPHLVIPHYVWIYRGIYIGATAKVNFELVRYVLQHAALPPLAMKNDLMTP